MVLILNHYRGSIVTISLFDEDIAKLRIIGFNKKSRIEAKIEFLFSRLNQEGKVKKQKSYFLPDLDYAVRPFLDTRLFPEREYTNYNLSIFLGLQDMVHKNLISLCYNASKEVGIIRTDAKKKF